MPQMAPLLWLNLMIMFLVSFLVFHSVVYFIKLPAVMNLTPKKKAPSQKIWKW